MRLKKAAKWIIAVALLMGIGILLRSCVPPSERSVVRNFQRHEDAFEKLLVMFDEDSSRIFAVSSDSCRTPDRQSWCSPEELGISQERHTEYRRLLKLAGAGSIIRRDDETCFSIAGSGFGSHGWRLGIVHRGTQPSRIIPSLSEFTEYRRKARANQAYCPIKDNWYIWIIW
jgi:hypothetical protein